jgi:DNA-binding transcriptional ArsR family regulator
MPNEKTELIPWVPMPTVILLHPALSASAKVLYGILQTWDLPDKDGHRKGFIYPSLVKIAERAGVDDSYASRLLKELEEAGAIHTELDRKVRSTATRQLTAEAPDNTRVSICS